MIQTVSDQRPHKDNQPKFLLPLSANSLNLSGKEGRKGFCPICSAKFHPPRALLADFWSCFCVSTHYYTLTPQWHSPRRPLDPLGAAYGTRTWKQFTESGPSSQPFFLPGSFPPTDLLQKSRPSEVTHDLTNLPLNSLKARGELVTGRNSRVGFFFFSIIRVVAVNGCVCVCVCSVNTILK